MTVNGVDMKENIISYKGIRTNNLRNISIELQKAQFYGVAGPSGSGKSSLAYGTMHAIAQHEWEKVAGVQGSVLAKYVVDEYENVIPSVALKQENHNQNPRSTIATFLRLDKSFRLLFASACGVSPTFFSFNNPRNACPKCEGLGYVVTLDTDQLIKWDLPIEGKPFLPWRKSYYQNLLEAYAKSRGIPLNVSLHNLPKSQVDLLLYEDSAEKLAVSYSLGGKRRTHRFFYRGFCNELESLANDKKHVSSANKVTSLGHTGVCPHCNGQRFSDEVLSYTYQGVNLGTIYMMEASKLEKVISDWFVTEQHQERKRLLNGIATLLQAMTKAQLGYLHLNRSIPTLSGGELQRIRLLNILTSQINDMMYIVDEPSAQLHVSEYDALLTDMRRLTEDGNTVVMIEHNHYFLERTDHCLFVGPGSGNQGGHLSHSLPEVFPVVQEQGRDLGEMMSFRSLSANNVENVDVDIPVGRITGLYGPSGSGKSTLARCIEQQYDKTVYVNQRPIKGTVSSTIASYSEVFDEIRNLLAKENNVDTDWFSFSGKKGACPACGGRGSVKYQLDFGKTEIELLCEECNGRRYNDTALGYHYKGLSIFEILNKTIDSLLQEDLFEGISTIVERLQCLQRLGLGYLTLFRTTDTLSGGEAQRLKLAKYIGRRQKGKLFIFDEPLRGLDNKSVANILSIFREITNSDGTVLMIEHNVIGLAFCDYILEMGPGKGRDGGKIVFSGTINAFRNSDHYQQYAEKM
jgi:excinuclease ABC subunit A